MKLSTTVIYKHSVMAPVGFVFDETKLDEIGTNIFGEEVKLTLGNNVLRFTETHFNTMPINSGHDWEDFMDKHLTPYLIPVGDSKND